MLLTATCMLAPTQAAQSSANDDVSTAPSPVHRAMPDTHWPNNVEKDETNRFPLRKHLRSKQK